MIATIVGSILITLAIIGLIIEHYDDETVFLAFGLIIIISVTIISLSLLMGKPHHSFSRQYIEYLLENDLSKENLTLAEHYNIEEHTGNNYWCRFTLRDENLIDIDYYINKKIGTDE